MHMIFGSENKPDTFMNSNTPTETYYTRLLGRYAPLILGPTGGFTPPTNAPYFFP